jgi:hypothetical protein
MTPSPDRAFGHEIEVCRRQGGGLRMSAALRLGINRKRLYAMHTRMWHVERAMRPYLEAMS